MNKEMLQDRLEEILNMNIVSWTQIIGKIDEYIELHGEDEYIKEYSFRIKKEYEYR